MNRYSIPCACACFLTQVSLCAADHKEQLARIAAQWESRHDAIATAKVEFRRFVTGDARNVNPASADQLRNTILGFSLKDNPSHSRNQILEYLWGTTYAKLDSTTGLWLFDGERVREEHFGFTQVRSDGSHLRSDPKNQLVQIYDRGASAYNVVGWNTFRFLPSPLLMDQIGDVSPSPLIPGSLLLKWVKGDILYTYLVDETDGDVFCYERFQGGKVAEQIFQWDFRDLPGGGRLPFVKIEVTYSPSAALVDFSTIDRVETNVELKDEDFMLAAPPGTLVYDHRGISEGGAGRSFRNDREEKDLLAYVDAVRESVDAQVNAPPAAPSRFPTVLVLTVNLVTIMAIALVLLVRYRREKKAAHPEVASSDAP
jgi:hypothetical protein